MKFTSEFDKALGICAVRVTGRHTRPDDSLILQRFTREFGEERGCRKFLFDMTQATISGGTMGAFQTGTVPLDPDRRQTEQRIALVYSGEMADHEFMENVAVNRGYEVRVFDAIDKAILWLNSKDNNTS